MGRSALPPDIGGDLEGDALLAMLLHAREDAVRLNRPLTVHFLEMACLDLAEQCTASWMGDAPEMERRRSTLRPD